MDPLDFGGGTGKSGDMRSFQKATVSALVTPLILGDGRAHLYVFPAWSIVPPS